MDGLDRRLHLRRLAGLGGVAAGVASAGCSVGGHHDADISVANDDSEDHQVTVTLTRKQGSGRIRKRADLGPGEDVRYERVIPAPAKDVHRYAVEVTLADDGVETYELALGQGSGFHSLYVRIGGSGDITISPTVH